jgi:hypothetical protein
VTEPNKNISGLRFQIAEDLLFPSQAWFQKLNGTRRTSGVEIIRPASSEDSVCNLFFRAIKAELY